MGLTNFVVTSSGKTFSAPRFFRKSQGRLARLQRQKRRKKPDSHRAQKHRVRVARVHQKVSNQRADFLHNISSELARENQTVYAEDLNVKGMVKNPHLSKSISDVGWGTFLNLLEYKLEERGGSLIRIGRYQKSSGICHHCGEIKMDLTLSDRKWLCSCGQTMDRDYAAAIQIKKLGQDRSEVTPVETRATSLETCVVGKALSNNREPSLKRDSS